MSISKLSHNDFVKLKAVMDSERIREIPDALACMEHLPVKQFEDENTVAKYTIPAPAQTYLQFIVPGSIEKTRRFYETNEELIEDIGKAYQNVIKQFYDAGCRNLQLDDCSWGSAIGDSANKDAFGIDINEFKEQLLNVNTVADYVFARENVDALLLEYDDERSGSFEPLAKVSANKKVVLGLITTKSPKLEDKNEVIKRIYEAAKYISLDRLCLSPQCGFASCEIGNKLTEEEQWAKLKLVKEIAEEVWG